MSGQPPTAFGYGIGGYQNPDGDDHGADDVMEDAEPEGHSSDSEEDADIIDITELDTERNDGDADADGDDDDNEDADRKQHDEDDEDEDEDDDDDEMPPLQKSVDSQQQQQQAMSSSILNISDDDSEDALGLTAPDFAQSASAANALTSFFGLQPPAPAPFSFPSSSISASSSVGPQATDADFLTNALNPDLESLAAAAVASRDASALSAELEQVQMQAEADKRSLRAEIAVTLEATTTKLQNQLDQVRAEAEQKVAAVQAELKATTDALATEKTDNEHLRAKLGEITNQLKESQDRTAELEHDKAEVAAAAAAAELGQLPDGSDAAVGAPQAVITSLRIQLKSTASSNRELLRALEREKTSARQAEDRSYELNIKVRETQNQVTKLLSEIQGLKNADSTRNFKLTSVSQELELSRKELDFVRSELSKLQHSSSQFRITKSSEVSRLQTALTDAESRATALEKKVTSLQGAYDKGLVKQNELLERAEEAERRRAEDEASFKGEMDTQVHLVSLYEQRASEAERRAKAVEVQWEDVTRGWKEREDQTRLRVVEEMAKREAAEKEKEELKVALDQLAEGVGIQITRDGADASAVENGAAEQALIRAASADPNAQQGSSAGGLFGSLFGGRARSSTPAGPMLSTITASPSAQLASRLQKSGKSFTQVYHELSVATEELRREREEHGKVSQMLREVAAEAQHNEARWRAEREDATNTTRQLEVLNREFALVCSESQKREKGLKREQAELARVARENALLESQVVDQGRQIRALLREQLLRDDPSAADRLEDDGTDLAGLSRTDANAVPQDTSGIITANLVTFKSLSEMVTQNQRLLRMTRELASRMEARDREGAAANGGADGAANGLDEAELEELRSTLDQLEEQLRAERSNKKALIAERDLLKSRLQRSTDASGVNGMGANGSGASAGGGNGATAAVDAALIQAHELLRMEHERLQRHYETYRAETAEDLRQLKDDVSQARRESAKAGAKAAREKASREAADERYLMLQQSFEMQRDETHELSRQAQKLRNNYAKAEISIQALDSNLSDARASLEQARTAAANATAERDLAKSMEKRVMDEHRSLLAERSSLTQLLQSVQMMQLDLEKAGSQNRERLESQVGTLETTVRDLKERLAKEEADHRDSMLRREVEAKEAHTKLDAANAELLEAKKQLVDTNGKLTQLSTKHDELSNDLQLKIEKLAVYERQSSEEDSDGVSKEKKLEMELAEVRGNLKALAVELESTKAHMEQYKSIAQGAEDATEQLQATLEETKKDATEQVAAKENEMNSIKQRMNTFIDELNKTQEEAADLKKQLSAQRAEFNSQKKELEDTLTQLTGAEEAANAREGPIRSDRDQQARLAEEAERKYQSELVSHAKDVEELHRVRDQLRSAQTESREAVKAKETAEAKLTGSEASWSAQREAIGREMDDLKKSMDDLKKQNALLHDALESANDQANKLRQAHAESSADNFDPDQSVSTLPSAELGEVVRFLRKEKEIVDVQLELSRQEAARLRQSLDYANAAIDKLRTELSEERGKVVAASGSSAQQQDLLEKVQQVNLLRESNATLRQETERAKSRIATLEVQLRTIQTELQPLRERATMAEAELESSREQAKILEEDSKRWQTRVQNILAQYNQQDPEEVRSLKEQAAKVDGLVETNQRLQGELAAANSKFEGIKNSFSMLRNQTKTRLEQSSAQLEEAKKQISTKEQEHSEALTALQTKLDAATANAESESGVKAVAEAQGQWNEEKKQLEQRNETHLARAKEFLSLRRVAEAAQKEAETKLTDLQKELDEIRSGNSAEIEKAVAERLAEFKKSAEMGGQLDEADSNLLSLQERLAKQEEELKQAQARIAELEAALAATASGDDNGDEDADGEDDAASAAEIEALKAKHAQELTEVRTEATARAMEKQQELEAQIAKMKKEQAAVEDGTGAAAAASAEPNPEKVEEEVQKRLSALESEREAAQTSALKAAVEAQLKEVAEKHKEEVADAVERAKNEANLRNQLHLSKRDKTILNLQKELTELKGQGEPAKEEEKPVASTSKEAAPAAAEPAPADASKEASTSAAATAAARPLAGQTIAGRVNRTLRGNTIRGSGGAAVAGSSTDAAPPTSSAAPAAPTGPAKRKAATGEDAGNTSTEKGPAKKQARSGGGRAGRRGPQS
ncbi:unnamed protein product [Tilletia controversa]|uniref:Uncharacterized protein n=2 Tax=Tilletia TaxID=13289 RepID=A0A177U7M8_9BASI|nr:hypothetical protein CF336_g6040 [Tilletia laevis]KAE8191512.1 hypothetical protein CF328_g5659 [Tilletia controversa]KAE8256682.1 hypothetical protein A4X03_0g5162 [Tilletia caries]KAE8194462.1 hypothetical protein CF335_g5339 [Tilletia laevis]CAD6889268.1 unnamed protein product [Tilletia caries]